MAQPQQNQAPQGIWGKLMEIQRKFRSFAISEDSDKVDAKTGKSAYRYTPGWEIVEKIREEMDRLGLMLTMDSTFKQIDVVDYPVYKFIGNNATPRSFTKKELHVAIEAEFTWVDTATGEKEGPYRGIGAGANGTDKSTASALALAERYFLLKFFHITTHDPKDEPDAHDSDNVPGIDKNLQRAVKDEEACQAVPYGQPVGGPVPQPQPQAFPGAPAPQGGYPPYGGGFAPQRPVQQPYGQPAMPVGSVAPVQQGGGQQVNVFTVPPQYGQGGPAQGAYAFNETDPNIRKAVERLMQFQNGTDTHGQILNQCAGELTQMGYCVDHAFLENLKEAAQARRENRSPRYI